MTQFSNQNQGRELGWDESISAKTIEDNTGFVLLPEGEYEFTVKSFERQRYTPGLNSKIPACPRALVTLEIIDPASGRAVDVQNRIYLHSTQLGMVTRFFECIGAMKHGDDLKMNWSTIVGKKGHCFINHRTYNGNEYNNLKSLVLPKSQPTDLYSFEEGKF